MQSVCREEPLVTLSRAGVCYWRKRRFFRRHPFWALTDVSLQLYPGESLGVIGRNGAGKTTLLQLLAGIIDCDRGTIAIRNVQAAMLSLRLGFLQHLTGRENAILSGLLLGLSRRDIMARLLDIKDFSELGEFFELPISTYSAGMVARLGFSVAFQADPDILLIDEVLGVGDAAFKEKSQAVLHEKIRSHKTVVLVSHNVKVIRDLCDRAVWIENGVSRMEGNTSDVIEAYEAFLKQKAREQGAARAVRNEHASIVEASY